MNKLDQLRKKASEPKGLCYLAGYDDREDFVCEVHSDGDFCPECAEKKAREINDKIASFGNDLSALQAYLLSLGSNAPDDAVKTIRRVHHLYESCPEADGFRYCSSCGALLDAYNLLTFPDQEIGPFLEMEDLDPEKLSPQNAAELLILLEMDENNIEDDEAKRMLRLLKEKFNK